MKVGDYVRTTSGIERLKKENDNGWFFEKNMIIKPDNIEKYIIKSSPNIIDLIEVGDYVNGEKVINIIKKHKYLEVSDEEITIDEKDIKSIVTKEQFESMKYKVNKND